MNIILGLVIGYLFGSIPSALIIGQVFYKKDIRNYGSGNLGGTNAGRVLGKKAGIAVIVMDLLKVIIAIAIVRALFGQEASIIAGAAAAFGHCYPVFAGFRGGKAVATMFGFLLATSIFTFEDPWYLLVPLAVFLVMLLISKMVSLSAMLAAISSTIFIIVMGNTPLVVGSSVFLTVLVLYRHRANIQRIAKGEESKITWLSKKEKK